MAKIRLGAEEIKYITLFEAMTGAKVRDCVALEDAMGFLIHPGQMGKAIGKKGASVERVQKTLGKKIWLSEYHEDKMYFIRNLFQPVRLRRIQLKEGKHHPTVIIEVSPKDRKKILGHNGQRIKIAKKLIQRHNIAEDIMVKSSRR